MKNNQAMAGGSVGYVRGVFSARCRGVAIPAELLRAHLRGVARVGVRRRLAAEFSGYLADGRVVWDGSGEDAEWLDAVRSEARELVGGDPALVGAGGAVVCDLGPGVSR